MKQRVNNERTEADRLRARESRLRRLFNLLPGDYERLLARQGGTCAVCARPPRNVPLAVDHCHATGLVRGALCSRCNRAIAAFRDDPQRLLAAARYLLHPPATEALGAPRYGLRGRVTNKAATRKRLNRRPIEVA